MKKLSPEQKNEIQDIITNIGAREGRPDVKNPLRIHKTRYEDWGKGYKEMTEMYMYDFLVDKSINDIFEYHYYQFMMNLLNDIKK